MDLISDTSGDLFETLAVFTGDEKEEFFRWALENESQDSQSHHMLFGHPYYKLRLENGMLETAVPLEFINEAHRKTISSYVAEKPTASRLLSDDLLFFRVTSPQNRAKQFIIAFTLAGLAAFCKARSEGEALTLAEQRTLAQLLTGVDLKQAAVQDSVSYETKRTQLKSINIKLGFSRQVDLVAELLSEILLEIILLTGHENRRNTSVLEHYLTMYAPRQIRVHNVQSKSGETIAIIDLGPVNGRPLISLQTAIPPNFGDDFVDALTQSNIRLISPMRNGALNPEDPLLSFEDHLDHAIDGILTAYDFLGVKTCSLLASGPNSRIAVEFASRHPEAVYSIVFQSIMHGSAAHFFSSPKLAASISNLAINSPLTLNLVLKFLNNKLQEPLGPLKLLRNAFKKNPQDLRLLENEFFSPDLSERLRYALSNSTYAILHDFIMIAKPRWEQLKLLNLPTHFIHGAQDKICRISDVEALAAELKNSRVHTIEDMERYPVDQQRVEILKGLDMIFA